MGDGATSTATAAKERNLRIAQAGRASYMKNANSDREWSPRRDAGESQESCGFLSQMDGK